MIPLCFFYIPYLTAFTVAYRRSYTAIVQEENPEPYRHAIAECIENNILADYLRKKGSEVRNMLIAEYDYDLDMEVQREEPLKKDETKLLMSVFMQYSRPALSSAFLERRHLDVFRRSFPSPPKKRKFIFKNTGQNKQLLPELPLYAGRQKNIPNI